MARGEKAYAGQPRPMGKALTPARSFGKHPGGRPSGYDPIYCEQVVQAMRQGYSLTAFAGLIDVARSTINEWMAVHSEFSEAVARGKAGRLVHWETAAMRVAQSGGGPGTATIIVFGLKNMGGDDWNDKTQVELSGKDGGPVKTDNTIRVIFEDPDDAGSSGAEGLPGAVDAGTV